MTKRAETVDSEALKSLSVMGFIGAAAIVSACATHPSLLVRNTILTTILVAVSCAAPAHHSATWGEPVVQETQKKPPPAPAWPTIIPTLVQIEDLVRRSLLDPDSMRDFWVESPLPDDAGQICAATTDAEVVPVLVHTSWGEDEWRIFCRVNARNHFGGYTGLRRLMLRWIPPRTGADGHQDRGGWQLEQT